VRSRCTLDNNLLSWAVSVTGPGFVGAGAPAGEKLLYCGKRVARLGNLGVIRPGFAVAGGRCTLENRLFTWAMSVTGCGLAVAGALGGGGCLANTPLKLTWLITARVNGAPRIESVCPPTWFPAPAKQLNSTVRRRLHRQSSGKDEKEGHTQATMRPSFKRMGL